MQEIGRAGRDGEEATALLLFNASHISSTIKDMAPEMKKYCMTNGCRRLLLSEYFDFQFDACDKGHYCCDNCAELCKCGTCILSMFKESTVLEDGVTAASVVSGLHHKKAVLLNLFAKINEDAGIVSGCRYKPDMYTGLSESLADKLVECPSKYVKIENLLADFPYISMNIAEKIYTIMQKW